MGEVERCLDCSSAPAKFGCWYPPHGRSPHHTAPLPHCTHHKQLGLEFVVPKVAVPLRHLIRQRPRCCRSSTAGGGGGRGGVLVVGGTVRSTVFEGLLKGCLEPAVAAAVRKLVGGVAAASAAGAGAGAGAGAAAGAAPPAMGGGGGSGSGGWWIPGTAAPPSSMALSL